MHWRTLYFYPQGVPHRRNRTDIGFVTGLLNAKNPPIAHIAEAVNLIDSELSRDIGGGVTRGIPEDYQRNTLRADTAVLLYGADITERIRDGEVREQAAALDCADIVVVEQANVGWAIRWVSTRQAKAISDLYCLKDAAFQQRYLVMSLNIRRALLEAFIQAPDNLQGNLDAQARLWIVAQRNALQGAGLTNDQASDFEARTDNDVANAVVIVRQCYEEFPDRGSREFQMEAANRLDLPIA